MSHHNEAALPLLRMMQRLKEQVRLQQANTPAAPVGIGVGDVTACLLRSGQRGAGDVLRQALELVLEFCMLAGERRMEEYEAAPLLEDLARRFRVKMGALTKALRALVDKPLVSSVMTMPPVPGAARKPTGGIEALAHLVESMSDWWAAAL